VYFVSPYFDHEAFMHHPMHVLDAPVGKLIDTSRLDDMGLLQQLILYLGPIYGLQFRSNTMEFFQLI